MAPEDAPDARRRAALIRLGQHGPRDAVAAALARQEPAAHMRLAMTAAQFVRRFARDPAVRPEPCGAREQFMILSAILDFGEIAAARAFVAATEETGSGIAGLDGLRDLIARAPARDAGAPGPALLDDAALDVLTVERPGAPLALFVFTGASRRFGAPLMLVHEWFRRLDASLVYVRDFHDMFYLAGLRGLGEGYGAAAAGLAALAVRLGAGRIACIGHSSGGYGALRFGLDLGAERVLCLSGPTVIDRSRPMLLERRRRTGIVAEALDAGTLDLADLYRAAPRRPDARLLFGAENAHDRAEAENMARVPGTALVPLDGVSEHGILPALVRRGGFDPELRWLMEDAR